MGCGQSKSVAVTSNAAPRQQMDTGDNNVATIEATKNIDNMDDQGNGPGKENLSPEEREAPIGEESAKDYADPESAGQETKDIPDQQTTENEAGSSSNNEGKPSESGGDRQEGTIAAQQEDAGHQVVKEGEEGASQDQVGEQEKSDEPGETVVQPVEEGATEQATEQVEADNVETTDNTTSPAADGAKDAQEQSADQQESSVEETPVESLTVEADTTEKAAATDDAANEEPAPSSEQVQDLTAPAQESGEQ